MTTDFRALCTELVDIITAHVNPDDCAVGYVAGVLTRARFALADEPAAGEPASVTEQFTFPADDDLLDLAEDWPVTSGPRHDLSGCPEVPLYSVFADELLEFARAVLARWGRPESVPNPWKDTLLDALVCNFLLNAENEDDPKKALNDLIAWEKQLAVDPLINPALQPVPISERPPGPKDCDAEGRCWWWYPEVPGKTYGYWAHEDDAVPERAFNEQPLHWLPAHALPLPEVGQ